MGLLSFFTGRPKPLAFAKLVIKALARDGFAGPYQYDAESFALQVGDGDQARTIFLHNAYEHYLAAPRRMRHQIIRELTASTIDTEMPKTWDEAKPMLRPRVRDRFYHWVTPFQLERMGQKPEKLLSVVMRDLTEDWIVELSVDMPHSIMPVDRETLDQWEITEDEALSIARDNLWKASNQDFQQVQPGLYLSSWEDNWDASRVFLHDLIWQLEVKGDHVVTIPNRDTLLVTGSQDSAGLDRMAEVTEQAMTDPRPMSPMPLVLKEGRWQTFDPEPDHSSYRSIQRLQIIAKARDYAEQKDVLEQHYEQSLKDVFVATYSVAQEGEDGPLFSYCVWPRDTVSELPKTDRVAVMPAGPEGEVIEVPWDGLMRVAGTLMKPMDVYPVRYAVDQFFSDEQLVQLREIGNAR